ncbi:hypothetical protein ACFSL4_01530 [Streptomyces caeni]|uniref:Uncharacterized protein n=1 Tax=Streptomyces caeni TaxID=2307231 RepID=A0ABW4IJY6_9ACTN
MIAYVFLGGGCTGVGLLIAAVRYGRSAADIARRIVDDGGARRITARQLRHELRLARHELAGAGEYITRLKQDRRELSGALEHAHGRTDDLTAQLEKAARQIAELDEQLRDADQLREANAALTARLANVTAIRPLAPAQPLIAPATPRPGSVVLPLPQAPFAHSPAAEPS